MYLEKFLNDFNQFLINVLCCKVYKSNIGLGLVRPDIWTFLCQLVTKLETSMAYEVVYISKRSFSWKNWWALQYKSSTKQEKTWTSTLLFTSHSWICHTVFIHKHETKWSPAFISPTFLSKLLKVFWVYTYFGKKHTKNIKDFGVHWLGILNSHTK